MPGDTPGILPGAHSLSPYTGRSFIMVSALCSTTNTVQNVTKAVTTALSRRRWVARTGSQRVARSTTGRIIGSTTATAASCADSLASLPAPRACWPASLCAAEATRSDSMRLRASPAGTVIAADAARRSRSLRAPRAKAAYSLPAASEAPAFPGAGVSASLPHDAGTRTDSGHRSGDAASRARTAGQPRTNAPPGVSTMHVGAWRLGRAAKAATGRWQRR